MPDHFFVYPAYLGRDGSRKDGRRVPAAAALADLTGEEIAQAAERLGYKAEIESDKHYPRATGTYGGRVKVRKRAGTSKAAFLRLLAAELARKRPPAGRK